MAGLSLWSTQDWLQDLNLAGYSTFLLFLSLTMDLDFGPLWGAGGQKVKIIFIFGQTNEVLPR